MVGCYTIGLCGCDDRVVEPFPPFDPGVARGCWSGHYTGQAQLSAASMERGFYHWAWVPIDDIRLRTLPGMHVGGTNIMAVAYRSSIPSVFLLLATTPSDPDEIVTLGEPIEDDFGVPINRHYYIASVPIEARGDVQPHLEGEVSFETREVVVDTEDGPKRTYPNIDQFHVSDGGEFTYLTNNQTHSQPMRLHTYDRTGGLVSKNILAGDLPNFDELIAPYIWHPERNDQYHVDGLEDPGMPPIARSWTASDIVDGATLLSVNVTTHSAPPFLDFAHPRTIYQVSIGGQAGETRIARRFSPDNPTEILTIGGSFAVGPNGLAWVGNLDIDENRTRHVVTYNGNYAHIQEGQGAFTFDRDGNLICWHTFTFDEIINEAEGSGVGLAKLSPTLDVIWKTYIWFSETGPDTGGIIPGRGWHIHVDDDNNIFTGDGACFDTDGNRSPLRDLPPKIITTRPGAPNRYRPHDTESLDGGHH